MSKISRQEAKQNRAANKQNTAPTQKQSTSNGSTEQVSKQDQPVELKATNSTAKQTQAASKSATGQASKQNVPASKPMTRQAVKFERRQEEKRRREEEHKRAALRKRITIVSVVAAVALLSSVLGYFVYTGYIHPSTSTTATAVPTLVNPDYPPVDGISCDTLEQTADHYHAHLSIYINGQHMVAPAQVGIAPDVSCYYWLHTHGPDGIVHMEAPPHHTFVLGNFLDIWGQKFSNLNYPAQLDQSGGPNWQVYLYLDGQRQPFNGNFHDIVMKPHLLITLAYNSPNVKPDTIYNWNGL